MCSQGHRALMSDSEGGNAGRVPGQRLPPRPGQRVSDLSGSDRHSSHSEGAAVRAGTGDPHRLEIPHSRHVLRESSPFELNGAEHLRAASWSQCPAAPGKGFRGALRGKGARSGREI